MIGRFEREREKRNHRNNNFVFDTEEKKRDLSNVRI